jgi:hypothetical protein
MSWYKKEHKSRKEYEKQNEQERKFGILIIPIRNFCYENLFIDMCFA